MCDRYQKAAVPMQDMRHSPGERIAAGDRGVDRLRRLQLLTLGAAFSAAALSL